MNNNVVTNVPNHEMKMVGRNILTITGINKIISFDATEFILESNMGLLHITGSSLELLNLDTSSGIIKIKGKINGYNYIEKNNKKREESFISKLFK